MQIHQAEMNVVFIVPTGLGAEIGGHAGDANPAAKLIASVSDTLITHPNVVNASDINEMTENTLYVEGSILDRFLMGEIRLSPVSQNKILLAVNAPIAPEIVNSVSAARATVGANIDIVVLDTPLTMRATKDEDGVATGTIEGWEELICQLSGCDFDALAISSTIEVDSDVARDYFKHGGVNPFGGVEAKASRMIASELNKPVAHAPFGHTINPTDPVYRSVVDPRLAAEFVSECYLHCVLKGLHRAPRIESLLSTKGFTVDSVSCLVSPADCFGTPHQACLEKDIPVIIVKQNKTCLPTHFDHRMIYVENYLEATGVISAMRAGISRESVLRPAHPTIIHSATGAVDSIECQVKQESEAESG